MTEKESHAKSNGFHASAPAEGKPVELAVIGIGCLFPKAAGLKEYWSNIKARVDGITEVPPSHWRPEEYFDADPKRPDMTYARRGGFLPPVDFDPTEFGITPNNIPATDPAQLLGLVVAQAALRDAGYGPERTFDRRKVSVLLGVTGTLESVVPLGARLGHPVWRRALREAGIEGERAEAVIRRISDSYVEWQENSFPGLLGNVVAGRIANRLDLGGTNCVVDAACASGLAAAHLAELELASGRADMVVTGGVDAFNDIFMFMCFSKTPALSPTGDSKPFDADGDGTILGEGLGMIVLKRLADAERDGDRVYAVLKGLGSSSDGRGKAIYAPSAEGQVKALQAAYEISGVSPATVELVEAHGTGTKVGDAAEVRALAEVYGAAGRKGAWVALGSVKSNLGHTKAAAGSAGLIKAIMALKNKVLPPTIKVRRPLAELAAGETPFYVNTEKRPWLASPDHPRRAAVSAFGFGGSNFHAVLEEYGPSKAEPDWDGTVELVALSAADLPGLRALAAPWTKPQSWDEVRASAFRSRRSFSPSHAYRLVVPLERGASPEKLFASVAARLASNESASWRTLEGACFGGGAAAGKLAFLFPGQGAQYVGMGRDLACQFPEMLEVLAEADRAFGSRLSDLIYPQPAFEDAARAAQEAALRATAAAQPAIGATSLGMLRILGRFGVRPQAAAGHSYGELTALCASGRLEPSALHRLSKKRGELMASGGGDKGAMLAVLAPIAEVERAVREDGLDVVLANKNAPSQAVLSGSSAAAAAAARSMERRGFKIAPLPVAAAFHSRLVADAKVPFREAIDEAALSPARIPVYANTTGRPYPEAERDAKDLLAGQLAAPVEFIAQTEAMHADGVRLFLEVGPGARLTGLVASILDGREHLAVSVDASAGRKPGVLELARALAHIAAAGHPVDLTPWEGGEAGAKDALEKKKARVSVPLTGATPVNSRRDLPIPPTLPPLEAPPSVPASLPAPDPAPNLAQALRVSREGIAALQKLQEQAANLHRQYLEGQETAQRTLLALIERQQRLLTGGSPQDAGRAAPSAPQASGPSLTAVEAPRAVAPSAAIPEPAAPTGETHDGPASGEIASVLLAVVSEKTGYPTETLNLDMGLESDLGIDSIKRVEILAALREKLPGAPAVGPQHIGTLRTLRQIIDFLSDSNGATGNAAGSGAEPLAGLSARDRGRGCTPGPRPDRPGRASGIASAAGARAGTPGSAEIERVLLSVVSEKTGYPTETLNLDMGLESDLGIDSIKRVEILAALREKLPGAPAVGPQHIGTLRTLRQIIDFLASSNGAAAPAPLMNGSRENGNGASAPAEAVSTHAASGGVEPGGRPSPPRLGNCASGGDGVERTVLSAAPLAGDDRPSIRPPQGSEIWVAEDGSLLAQAVAARLDALGYRPRIVAVDAPPSPVPSGLAGLILLSPEGRLGPDGVWPVESETRLKRAFQFVRSLAPALRGAGKSGGAVLVTVSRLDGSFGLGRLEPDADVSSGALAGLAKTAALEWPEVAAKAIDAAAGWTDLKALAESVVDEAFLAGPAEVGLSPDGRRTLALASGDAEATGTLPPAKRPVIEPAPAADAMPEARPGRSGRGQGVQPLPRSLADNPARGSALDPGDVVVVTGGARGVTAEAAVALAAGFRPALVLLGRTAEPAAEPDWLRGVSGESEMKKAILSAGGGRMSPKAIEEEYRRHAANREVRRTLERLEAAGAKARYLSVDLREDAAVAEALGRVRRELGPVRALIHGAGALADRKLEDKTPELFDSVFDVKIAGLRAILKSIDASELRAIALFSSVSGRRGRAGQADYAMANEFLNKAAQSLARRWPACRVVSINWGPWDGGMVTPSLRKVFAAEGAGLLGLEAGARHLVSELSAPAGAAVETVVVADGPAKAPAPSAAFERLLETQSHPFLASHVIGGHPVLPLAMMVEWLGHGALHGNPGLSFCGVDGLRVYKGVILKGGARSIRVAASKAVKDGALYRVGVELLDGDKSPHARAEVLLGPRAAEPAPGRAPAWPAYRRAVDAAYREVLFHGADLRAIESVDGISEQGIVVRLKTAPAPESWIREPLRTSWLADPLALDGAFQAMILWSFERHGAGCLPCHIGRYRQYRPEFPKSGVTAVVTVTRDNGGIAVADIDFLGAEGRLVARIEGSEHTIDASLNSAFRAAPAAAAPLAAPAA